MRYYLCLLFAFWTGYICGADDVLTLTPESLLGGQLFLQDSEHWKFHQGHHESWEDVTYNDSNWSNRSLNDVSKSMIDESGRFEGWFRIKFNLSDDFKNNEWFLRYISWAPAEIYLDGQKIESFGKITESKDPLQEYNPFAQYATPIRITANQDHVLAIRMADEMQRIIYKDLRSKYLQGKTKLLLQTPKFTESYNRLIGNSRYIYGTLRISLGIFLTIFFALVYFLNKNDAIAKYVTIISALLLIGSISIEIRNMAEVSFMIGVTFAIASRLVFGIVSFLAPHLLAKVIGLKLSRLQHYILIIALIIMAVPVLFNSRFPPQLGSIICLIVSFYLIIKNRNMIEGAAWVVVIGMIGTIITLILLVTGVILNQTNAFVGIQLLGSASVFILPVALVIYIALRYKEINEDVREKANHIIEITQAQRQKAIDQKVILEEEVKKRTAELSLSLDNLKLTQNQLIHAEKMASLGELTAGIAHEIQNPLNFVNNFSEVSADLIEEAFEEMKNNDLEEVKELLSDVRSNMGKISHHGARASTIVKGMLDHSRTGNTKKELADVNLICEEYLRLSYHGLRAKDKSFNAEFVTHLDPNLPKIKIVAQEIGRVILNIINNAFYAVNMKAQSGLYNDFLPKVEVTTKKENQYISIRISDNGLGMSTAVMEKIFQPFFTTKPSGQGTGLGMSLSYDIITNGHGGQLLVESIEKEKTMFTIILPIED